MTRFLSCRTMPYLGSGDVPKRSGGRDSVIAIYQAFETADYPITLGLGNLWQRFWEAVGEPQAAHDEGLRNNADRRLRRDEIVPRIAGILRTKPREHWLALFRASRVPSGPINSVDQVIADEAMLARGMFYRIAAEDGRLVPQVGTAIVIDGEPNTPRSAPPRLGEHNEAVLRDLRGGS